MEQTTYWDKNKREDVVDPKVDDFLQEIVNVYKKYNMSLEHEDNHGAFIISTYCEENVKWLKDAMIDFG